ncbi:MAG: hypothetical protein LUD72_11275 [Bacteroidales bacterium]|nr:hypothetical protein [Bacteroidales bacterium]
MEILQRLKEDIEKESDELVQREGEDYKCSVCGLIVTKGSNYCPGCGRRLNWRFANDTIDRFSEIIFDGKPYQVEDIRVVTCDDGGEGELTIKAKRWDFASEWLM